jgi:hypothetical protein
MTRMRAHKEPIARFSDVRDEAELNSSINHSWKDVTPAQEGG